MLLGFGVGILGWGKSQEAAGVKEIIRYRIWGMPDTYIVIENSGDEWIYCVDCSEVNHVECKVVEWDVVNGLNTSRAMNFEDFLLNRLIDGKKVFEEDF